MTYYQVKWWYNFILPSVVMFTTENVRFVITLLCLYMELFFLSNTFSTFTSKPWVHDKTISNSNSQIQIHNIFIVSQHTSYMIHNVSTQITFYWHIHIYIYFNDKPILWEQRELEIRLDLWAPCLIHLSSFISTRVQGVQGCNSDNTVITQ